MDLMSTAVVLDTTLVADAVGRRLEKSSRIAFSWLLRMSWFVRALFMAVNLPLEARTVRSCPERRSAIGPRRLY